MPNCPIWQVCGPAVEEVDEDDLRTVEHLVISRKCGTFGGGVIPTDAKAR